MNLWGSNNLRFFLQQQGEELSLFRESTLLWCKKLPQEILEVIGVGNNGTVGVRFAKGIMLYILDAEEPEYLIETLIKKPEKSLTLMVVNAKLDDSGENLCLERLTIEPSFSKKIKNLLSSTSHAKDHCTHELIFNHIYTGNQKHYYQYHSRKGIGNFIWNISPSFDYLIVGEGKPGMGGSKFKFSIIHVPSETIYTEFTVATDKVNQIKINNEGTAWLEFSLKDEIQWIAVNEKGVQYTMTHIPNVDFLHLGKTGIFIKDRDNKMLLMINFDESQEKTAELKSLDYMGIIYGLVFNDKDNMAMVSQRDDSLEVFHTDIDNFIIDCKRWNLMAKEKKEKHKARHASREDEEQKLESARKTRDRKIEELMESAKAFQKKEPKPVEVLEIETPPPVPPEKPKSEAPISEPLPTPQTDTATVQFKISLLAADKAKIYKLLEILELRRVTGNLSPEEYEKLTKALRDRLESCP
jgi:hypothetical protein